MSVSGKKEFDVKQILRLRWRWFSHPSQNATSPGVWLQQEGYEHRGTSVQNRLKNHSWDRSRLKKNSSPLHPNLLVPGPSLTPLAQQPASTCPQENLPAPLQEPEETPKTTGSPDLGKKGEGHESSQESQMITEEDANESVKRNSLSLLVLLKLKRFQETWKNLGTDLTFEEELIRLSVSSSSSSTMGVSSNGADTYFHSANHAEQTFRKMENYLQQKQLCDVLLIAGDHKIPAHRLQGNTDGGSAKQEEIKMEGVDPDALKDLVLYAYTGMLELKEDTIESLLAAACLLQLSPVIELLADLENSPMFTTDLQCQKLLMEAMKYHLLPERRSMMQSPRTKPRKSTVGSLYAVGGMDATKGVAMLEGPMYAVGGHDGWSYLNTVERWDPQARQWNYVASMSTPRSTVGVAALNSKYDPKTDNWTTVAPLSVPRDAVGICTLGDRLYAVGGYDGHTYLNTVESYDAQNNEWTEITVTSIEIVFDHLNIDENLEHMCKCKRTPNDSL
ncbi:Kelch-like protein 4, partial [Ophiophagus hannah]